VVSGQWSVVSGQWSVVSGQLALAQPAQRVSQTDPPPFFFLVSFVCFTVRCFCLEAIYVGFPKVFNFLRFLISVAVQFGLRAGPVKREILCSA
jgi:hypothetical protein